MATLAPAYASPLYVPKYRAFSAAGIPLAFGKVFVFVAGTSTPYTTYPTYADALAGSNANSHPVVLDANGEANIFVPVTNSLLKVILQDAAGVVQWTEDFLHPGVSYPGVTGNSFATEWRPITDVTSAVFVPASATAFVVNGVDVSSTFHVGRRVRTVSTGGVVFSTVVSVTFAAGNTQVNLVNDGAGVLDAGMSQVFYGINSYISPSYLDPRTAFGATKSGNQAAFAASTKVINWNVTVDAIGEWVPASNHWLCKYPGNYMVFAQMEHQNGGTFIATELYIATTVGSVLSRAPQRTPATGNQLISLTCHALLNLAAGATISMYVLGDGGTTVLTGLGTRLSIQRIP